MVINANNRIEQPRALIARRERSLTTTRVGIHMARREEVV